VLSITLGGFDVGGACPLTVYDFDHCGGRYRTYDLAPAQVHPSGPMQRVKHSLRGTRVGENVRPLMAMPEPALLARQLTDRPAVERFYGRVRYCATVRCSQ
jgi:hypothetical protein